MRRPASSPVAARLAAEHGHLAPPGRITSVVDALAAEDRDPLDLEHLARAEVCGLGGTSRGSERRHR